ncbi:HlyD family type I secretion periplasmic adaptor subunit [Afipia sp. TerB]
MPRNDTRKSIRRHIIAVGLAAVLMIGSIGIMGAATELAGAVVAPGQVVVESSVKKIQHPTGGVVGELLVSDGQKVEAGEVLIRLDPTVAHANLAAVTKAYWELIARQARLEAERDRQDDVGFPQELAAAAADPAIAAIMTGERGQFFIRKDSMRNRKDQLHQRVAQLKNEIAGLEEQVEAKTQERNLIQKELEGVEALWDQHLVSITRLTALRREQARLLGERGQLTAAIAQSHGKISETELQILQVDEDHRRDVAKELADVRSKFGETSEKRVAAQDTANRLEICSPQAGVVQDLAVHANGSVIGAGETIMRIVPDQDRLVVESRIEPREIDQVKLGQTAVLRFTNFNQRTTPEIDGTVDQVSADVSRREKEKDEYFLVRITISKQELDRLDHTRLIPGMPVEVFIRTADRTVLSYLMKPLADQARRAFREK